MKQTVQLENLSCQNCVKHVEQAIQSLLGIKKATVDLKKEQARVTYDDTQLSNEAIKDQINEQTHYHATILKTKRSLF